MAQRADLSSGNRLVWMAAVCLRILPGQTRPHLPLGLNIDLNDQAYVDLIQPLARFEAISGSLQSDDNGWPTSDFQFVLDNRHTFARIGGANNFDPLKYSTDLSGTYDGSKDADVWRQRRIAKRTLKVGQTFKKVFADSTGRIRPVINDANVFTPENMLQYVQAVYGPPSQYLYGIAITAYYSTSDRSSVAAILTGEKAASDQNCAAYSATARSRTNTACTR